MRPADPQTLTAWSCGGEVAILGGPYSLKSDEPNAGCRFLTIEEAYDHLLTASMAMGLSETDLERAYWRRQRDDLAAAILSVEQWRKAA